MTKDDGETREIDPPIPLPIEKSPNMKKWAIDNWKFLTQKEKDALLKELPESEKMGLLI